MMPAPRQPDFEIVNAAALAAYPGLLQRWFRAGRLEAGEFVVGNLQGDPGASLKINVKSGLWSDFATGERGGDPVSLYAAIHGLRQAEAAERLSEELGLAGAAPSRRKGADVKSIDKGDRTRWKPVMPVPEGAPAPVFQHHRLGRASHSWTYADSHGRLLGYVCRFDKPKGGKEILPFTLCRAGDGRLMWRWLGFPRPRPLYGLEELVRKPKANVVIVEGEKTADAARELLPNCAVITWPGGSKAIKQADWAPLKRRKVLIVPDADEPGRAAAEGSTDAHGVFKPGIAQMLAEIAAGVRVVDPPEDAPDGWDLADALGEGWTPERAHEFFRERMREPRAPRSPNASPGDLPPPEMDDYGVDGPAMAATADRRHFKALGHNKGTFYFLTARGQQVVEAPGRALRDKGLLFQLAPLHSWEREYPSENGFTGHAVDRAANALIEACYRAGVFRPERMRGRGAWWDDGRVVLHLGDRLVVEGAQTPISSFESRFIYEASAPIRCSVENPLATREAHRLHELCDLLMWEKPVYATLLAGWCVVAPICGALGWRPHIWITSAAGGGKSWVMDNIVRRCLGDIGLVVQSRTTEAGLRQTLGHDARPVVFDEAESEDSRASAAIDNVLALMRQASSETGGKIIKGTTSGRALSFDIRSCFAFASIGVNIRQQADATRITVLGLLKDNSPEAQKHFNEVIKPTARDVLTDEYCARLQARAVRFVNVIRRNADVFGEAAAEYLGNRRIGDQLGALLAGAYLLHGTNVIGLEAAREWVGARDWADQTEAMDDRDEVKLLATLMESRHRVDVGGSAIERNAAELVARAAGIGVQPDDKVAQDTAIAALARIGMKVSGERLVVSNSHSGIKRVLRDTPWATGWCRILKRIDGGAASTNVVRFGPLQSRAVYVPLSAAIAIGQ
jgi:putative DNA primase/helicase